MLRSAQLSCEPTLFSNSHAESEHDAGSTLFLGTKGGNRVPVHLHFLLVLSPLLCNR